MKLYDLLRPHRRIRPKSSTRYSPHHQSPAKRNKPILCSESLHAAVRAYAQVRGAPLGEALEELALLGLERSKEKDLASTKDFPIQKKRVKDAAPKSS